jgi:hypothetical protein
MLIRLSARAGEQLAKIRTTRWNIEQNKPNAVTHKTRVSPHCSGLGRIGLANARSALNILNVLIVLLIPKGKTHCGGKHCLCPR